MVLGNPFWAYGLANIVMSKEEDLELELILARKKRELLRQAALRQTREAREEAAPTDSLELVRSMLHERGDEVLEAALRQYPREARMVVDRLAELIRSGALRDKVSGRQLLWLFRQLGLDVKLETRIRVEKDGRFVSLVDAVRSKWSEE
jgi:DNA-binding TFAR19-related protein (PDSD5 family)